MQVSAAGRARVSGQATLSALVIDDDPLSVELLKETLGAFPLRVHGVSSREAALSAVRSMQPALVFLDLVMPGVRGLEMLDAIHEISPLSDVILVTGHYSTDSAIEAVQKGAWDYLTKPVDLDTFRERIRRWLEQAESRQHSEALEEELLGAWRFSGIIGRSPMMMDVFHTVQRIAPHFQAALITGETGTGKELVARALHNLSPCASGPFVVCNSAALVDTLFESELFGYVRGAFTGAAQDKPGLAEMAHGGTLFLDEVGEIPLHMQAKLLRFLQSREVRRVGANTTRTVSVRLIAATNRDLRRMVEKAEFREDLYYRLATVQLRLPNLASRPEDIPLLMRHFLDENARRQGRRRFEVSRKAALILSRAAWKGNIREMESVLSYACMMARNDLVDVGDLPGWFLAQSQEAGSGGGFGLVSLDAAARLHAESVLLHVGGNRTRAAEILGVSRATLYRLVPAKE